LEEYLVAEELDKHYMVKVRATTLLSSKARRVEICGE